MQLATAVVGGAVGFAIGGPFGARIGFTAGSIIGGMLFADSPATPEGTKLSELQFTFGAPGAPRPRVFGRGRVTGQPIWLSAPRRVEHTQSSGGGGCGLDSPEQTSTTYTYVVDVAYSFGEAPYPSGVVDVVRMWFNKDLRYHPSAGTSLETVLASRGIAENVRVYTGASTQDPDPLIEAAEGTAPAYRGTVYVVFEDLDLTPYGNTLPVIEAEVRTNGSVAVALTETDQVDAVFSSGGGFTNAPWHRGWVDANGAVTFWSGKALSYDSESSSNELEYRTYTVMGGVVHGPVQRLVHNVRGPQITTAGLRGAGRLTTTNSDFCYGDRPFDLWQTVGLVQFIDVGGHRDRLIAPLGGIDTLAGAALYGQHLYLHGRRTTDSTWWVWYADLSEVDPSATPLVQDPFSGATRDYVAVNCDAAGWWWWKSQSTYQLLAYPHGSGVASATIGLSRLYHGVWRTDSGAGDYVGHTATNWYTIDATAEVDAGAHDTGAVGADPWHQAAYGHGLAYTQNDSDLVPTLRAHTITRTYSGGNPTVAEIVADVCAEAGLVAGDLDTTELTDTLIGFTRSKPMPVRASLEPLAVAFAFDPVESDYKIAFRLRDRAAAFTVAADELAAHPGGGEAPPDVSVRRVEELELPKRVTLHHSAGVVPGHYTPKTSEAEHPTTTSILELVQELPLSFATPLAARQRAEAMLYELWSAREQIEFSVGPQHYAIDPGDVGTVTDRDGLVRTVRVTETEIQEPGTMVVRGNAHTRTVHVVSDDTDAPVDPVTDDTISVPGPTLPYYLDLPLLGEASNRHGWYWAARGVTTGWPGAALFWSRDDVAYTLIQGVTLVAAEAVTAGAATTVLATTARPTVTDTVNTVTVRVFGGATLAAATRAQVINGGANLAVLGDELIQYQDATDNGDGTWTLGTLLRGRRGTEWAMGTHAVDERFVVLDTSLEDIAQATTLDDIEIYLKSVSIGTTVVSTAPETFTNTNVRLKPFSPVRLRAARDGSNNITLTWLARTRLFAAPFRNAARGDDRVYEVDVMSGATVVRTITGAVTETASYTAVQQGDDGFTPGDPIEFNVYQVSGDVGRGYAGNDTV